MEKENLRGNKFISDILVRFSSLSFLQIRSIILLAIISKNYGTEGFGIYSQLIITISFLTPIFLLRFEIAEVRYFSFDKSKDEVIRKQFYSMLSLILILLIMMSTFLLLFYKDVSFLIFGKIGFESFIFLFSFLLISQVFYQFLLNYIRAKNRIKLYTIIEFSEAFLELGLLLFFIYYLTLGLISIFYSMIIIEIIFDVALLVYVIKDIGFDFSFIHGYKRILSPLLKYSLPLIPSGIFLWLINVSDRFVITYFLGIQSTGIYSASYTLAETINFIVTPIAFVLFPMISLLWNENKINDVKKYNEYALNYFLLLAIPCIFGITVLSQDLLKILTTSQFLTSQLLIFVVCVAYVFSGILRISEYILYLKQKTMRIPLILGIGGFLNLGLNILIVPIIGIMGAAITTLIGFFVPSTIYLYYSRKYLDISIKNSLIIKSIFCSIIMYLILNYFILGGIIGIIIKIGIGLLLYFILMILIKGIGRDEFHLFKNFLSQVGSKNH